MKNVKKVACKLYYIFIIYKILFQYIFKEIVMNKDITKKFIKHIIKRAYQ